MKNSFLKDNISDLERFILIVSFAAIVLAYCIFDVFEADVNPLIKLLPFLALGLYDVVKSKWNVRKSLHKNSQDTTLH